jgi:hypothetical protein
MEVKIVFVFYKEQGNGAMKAIKVEGERGIEKEVIVRHEIVSSKWKTSNHGNFSRDWNRNYSV